MKMEEKWNFKIAVENGSDITGSFALKVFVLHIISQLGSEILYTMKVTINTYFIIMMRKILSNSYQII